MIQGEGSTEGTRGPREDREGEMEGLGRDGVMEWERRERDKWSGRGRDSEEREREVQRR